MIDEIILQYVIIALLLLNLLMMIRNENRSIASVLDKHMTSVIKLSEFYINSRRRNYIMDVLARVSERVFMDAVYPHFEQLLMEFAGGSHGKNSN